MRIALIALFCLGTLSFAYGGDITPIQKGATPAASSVQKTATFNEPTQKSTVQNSPVQKDYAQPMNSPVQKDYAQPMNSPVQKTTPMTFNDPVQKDTMTYDAVQKTATYGGKCFCLTPEEWSYLQEIQALKSAPRLGLGKRILLTCLRNKLGRSLKRRLTL